MIRELYRQSTFRWALMVVGLLLPLFLGACVSAPVSPLSDAQRPQPNAPDDVRVSGGGVPLVFTAQTDTAEGAILVYLAQGAGVMQIRDPHILHAANANCSLYAVHRYGLGPDQGRSAGVVIVDVTDPRREPVFACVLDKTFQRAAMEVAAGAMKPPRVVLKYDPATRTVTFGPKEKSTQTPLTDAEILAAIVQLAADMQRAYMDALDAR